SLQVGTNGIISTQDFPRETQYVDDDFPTDFPVIAPFLADLDTSGDRGNIYYRQDESPDVLDQAVGYIQAGFPSTTGSFLPTNAFITTWEDVGSYQELSQDAEPSEKLNTFQAVIAYDAEDTYTIFLYPEGGLQFLGTRPKESYNVQLELPARVGFSRGDGDDPKRDGLFHSLASSEQALRNLERESNVGVPGVWVFHVGSTSPLEHVEPGGGRGQSPDVPPSATRHGAHQTSTELPAWQGLEATSGQRGGEGIVPRRLPLSPRQEQSHHLHPGGAQQSHSANPSSYSSGQHGVGVEEDEHFNPDASKETCAQHHRHCSPHAFCTDYATGACCHCRATYYGNGHQCLPEGAVHRLNGKVSGSLLVGRESSTFQDVDLHAYIVGSDGRAYTAISGVPQPAGRALLPLLPIGGLFAWLFALEEPGSENGFSITGAEFTQSLEVTFYPRGETVHITQTAEGLGPDNYLSLKTHIRGQVPFLPENTTVHITPYEELYHYSSSAVTSSAHREYTLLTGTTNQTLSYRLHQNITFSSCPYTRLPPRQSLGVSHAFTLYDTQEHVLRYALAARIAPAPADAGNPVVNPCHDSSHACEEPARCQPGVGMEYTCVCSAGYRRDGRGCRDVDECSEGLSHCGPFTTCRNEPGSYRCECRGGYRLAEDGQTCVPLAPVTNPCEDGSHPCAPGDRARCLPRAGGPPACQCLPGYTGDGIHCSDVDECAENPCHPAALCYNTPGSFSCHCQPGYEGDGFQCTYGEATNSSPRQLCLGWHPHPHPAHPLVFPGGVSPGDTGSVVPSPQHPNPVVASAASLGWRQPARRGRAGALRGEGSRPDVSPPAAGTFLLYAQGQQIGYLPLNGTRLQKEAARTLLSLHGSIVVGIDYDCRDKTIYWTDVAGRTISRASLESGAEPETIINSGLISPEGLAVDHLRRAMFWTDSGLDKIERARLDGSERRVLFDTELVNPRAITVDPVRGNLYWTDWNREAPKIETSTVNGANRRVLVNRDIGLPNGLTFDPFSKLLCWADAGTKHLECTFPDGTGRRIIQNNLNYPFSIISYANHFYHTDWRRDGVIAVDKETGSFTDEYLPEQRSHLYGITAVYPYCLGG
ncbi:Nidogen-2, partial [Calypte anna]